MSADGREKYGNLRVERGGLYAAPRYQTPEQWLDREIRSWAARGKSAVTGAYASRACADIAVEARWPHRIPARVIREALEGNASPMWARRFGELLVEFADRKARELGMADDDFGRVA